MKKPITIILSVALFVVSATAIAQIKPVEKCMTCGKAISLCQYKGKHPSPPKPKAKCNTCGKFINKCPYNGRHPKPNSTVQEPTAYDVTFTCNASSASMYIDGESYGAPNGTKYLKTGNHTIKLTAEGYKEYTSTFNVGKGRTEFHFDMEPVLYDVTITTNATDVTVYINGNKYSETHFKLPQGQHNLILVAEGYDDFAADITVNKEQTSFNFIMSRSLLSFHVNELEFTMVYVEGGTFTMGATPEQGYFGNDYYPTPHQVTLSDYCIGQFEITQELWDAVMDKNPSWHLGALNPVETVSWEDCQLFIDKLNDLTGLSFRLPTEVEWEFAARGGNKSKGFIYSGSNEIDSVAWYKGNCIKDGLTHPVGTKSPNELGLYDMSGNVWEWCQDWYGDYPRFNQTNPTGPKLGKQRIIRGGHYESDSLRCRVSTRFSYEPSTVINYIGFRLAHPAITEKELRMHNKIQEKKRQLNNIKKALDEPIENTVPSFGLG